MAAPKGTKAVQYFLPPDLIVDIKSEAPRLDMTQSELVIEACQEYLAKVAPAPVRGRRRKPEPAGAA